MDKLEFNGQESTASAVSPKGNVATGHEDGSVTLWGREFSSAGTNFPAHRRKVVGVAFTPDERILATAGEEGTAKLWDLATHREIVTLKGHLKSVHGLAISPDGLRLATAGGDRESVKLWDIQTHQELITLPSGASTITRLAFSPDGNKIIGLSGEGKLLIWRAPSWEDIHAATAPNPANPDLNKLRQPETRDQNSSGTRTTRPPITSPILKSFFGLSGFRLWQSAQALAVAVSA